MRFFLLATLMHSTAASALFGAQAEPPPGAAFAPVADAALETYRAELLELAFETAAVYPLDPHVKNRARALEAVAATCFELDQPRRALRCIEAITNWRRGAGYADFAHYCAEQGAAGEVHDYLQRALEVAAGAEDAQDQEWRADRIQTQVDRTRALLARREQAAPVEAAADSVSEDEFEARLAEVDGLVAVGDFELSRTAVEACVELFERCFDDEQRAQRIEAQLALAWVKLPVMIQVETRLRLAGIAAERGSPARTLAQVAHVDETLEAFQWRTEERVPVMARLAALRQRAGDGAGARAQVEAAVALYFEQRDALADLDRAGALRPVAEAYASMAERGKALEFYRRAVDEGALNPNLRPRIDDLVATCNSLARSGIEPDAELWERMRAIQAELAERVSTAG